eukprot:g2172.t1
MEDKSTRSFDIVHLDDRVLVVFAEANDPTEGQVLLVLIKKGTPPAPKIEESIKSEISIGRAAAVKSRRASVATLAERNYKKQMGINESQAKAPSAGREARRVAARSQKEQAEAKREATLKLKSEIKESVDEFGRRLKEAQTNKKDAATALKNFERENSEALKQANIFRKRLENFEMEAAGLANEIVMMADREKQSAAELKQDGNVDLNEIIVVFLGTIVVSWLIWNGSLRLCSVVLSLIDVELIFNYNSGPRLHAWLAMLYLGTRNWCLLKQQ